MTYDTKNPYPREAEGAYIEYTSSTMLLASMFEVIGAVNIPSNYQNGAFNDTETPQKARFMDISLINLTGINEGDNIVLDAGDSFTLDCILYLALYNNLKTFRIDSSNNDFSISIYDVNDTKIRDIQNNEDLKNYNINNTEFKVKITANTSTIINNIHFEIVTKTPDNDSKVQIFLDQIEGMDNWEDDLNNRYATKAQGTKADNAVPNTRKVNNKQLSNDITLTASDVDAYDKSTTDNKYATKIQTVTKKFSELVNGDYLIGYDHISSISGKFVTINLESGDWISLDGYDFSQSENFEGGFNSSYVSSGMSTSEIDSCFTFEVQRQTPQDLIDVKKEIFDNIDKIKIENYNNGFRIKKNGVYIYSRCFGSVEMTTTGSNGTASTTVNYPFTFLGNKVSMASASTGSALQIAGSTQTTGASSMSVTLQRSSAGTSPVRWYVEGV